MEIKPEASCKDTPNSALRSPENEDLSRGQGLGHPKKKIVLGGSKLLFSKIRPEPPDPPGSEPRPHIKRVNPSPLLRRSPHPARVELPKKKIVLRALELLSLRQGGNSQ